jgi:hypothetical protein
MRTVALAVSFLVLVPFRCATAEDTLIEKYLYPYQLAQGCTADLQNLCSRQVIIVDVLNQTTRGGPTNVACNGLRVSSRRSASFANPEMYNLRSGRRLATRSGCGQRNACVSSFARLGYNLARVGHECDLVPKSSATGECWLNAGQPIMLGFQ